MIASITGGRFHEPSPECLSQFLSLLSDIHCTHLNHGASGSVDWGVSTVVRYYLPHINVRPWPVDTSIDGPWPAAGNRRNARMLIESRSEVLFKFPGNSGTKDCYSRAKRLGLGIYVNNGFIWTKEQETKQEKSRIKTTKSKNGIEIDTDDTWTRENNRRISELD